MEDTKYCVFERTQGDELTTKELQAIYDAGWEKWDPEGILQFDPAEPHIVNGRSMSRYFFKKRT